MKKFYLLTKTLLVAVLLMGGANSAWGENMKVEFYSNDFSASNSLDLISVSSPANQTLTLASDGDSYGNYVKQVTADRNRDVYMNLTSLLSSSFANYSDYTVEFDAAFRSGSSSRTAGNKLYLKSTKSTNIFEMATPTTQVNAGDLVFTVTGAASGKEITLKSLTWYHFKFDITASSITYTVSLASTKATVTNGTGTLSIADSRISQVYFCTARYDGQTRFDNLDIYASVPYSDAYNAAKAPYDTKVASLDAAGQAYWTANVTSAASVTDEASYNTAVAALPTTYVAAVKAQTTVGSDMTDALKTAVAAASWEGATGTYAGVAAERYAGDDNHFNTGNILHQTVSGLHAGYYRVKFYGVANRARNIGSEYYGAGIAQMYANDETLDVDVIDQSGCTPISDTYLRTFEVYLSEDNSSIDFGIKNIKEGGQWYVAQALSLTYLGAALQDYTINYNFEDATIKSTEGSAAVGETINAVSPITISDQKYYATSATSMEIVEGENVLNVTLRKAENWNYTVRAINSTAGVINDNLASGTVTEGESTSKIFFPRFVLNGNTLYCSKTGTAWYSTTFTPDADDYIYDVTYNETPVANVAFYTEGEDVAGVSQGANGDRASMGKMGYTGGADTYKDVTTLTPGKYVLYTRFQNGSGSNNYTFNFKVGDTVVHTGTHSKGTNGDKTSDEFTVSTSSTLSFASGGNDVAGMDYFYLVKTAEAATISSYGYATFSSAYDLDFTTPISGLTAYKAASCDGSTVTFGDVTGKVKAGNGLVIKGSAGTYYIPVTTGASTIYDTPETINMWGYNGNETETVTAAATGTNFVLSVQDEKVVFAPIKETNATLNPGQAALWADVIVSESEARGLRMVFADDILTGINEAAAATEAAQKEGKFVVDGKLVIFKKGMKFNANGQRIY